MQAIFTQPNTTMSQQFSESLQYANNRQAFRCPNESDAIVSKRSSLLKEASAAPHKLTKLTQFYRQTKYTTTFNENLMNRPHLNMSITFRSIGPWHDGCRLYSVEYNFWKQEWHGKRGTRKMLEVTGRLNHQWTDMSSLTSYLRSTDQLYSTVSDQS